MSFSSLILSSCSVHGRKRPVWSCGVVDWIGRPLISPTPSPGHRQVNLSSQVVKLTGLSSGTCDRKWVFSYTKNVCWRQPAFNF